MTDLSSGGDSPVQFADGSWGPPNIPSPFDAASRTRIPSGWIQFADGSWGPPRPSGPMAQTPGLPAPTGRPGPPVRIGGMPSLAPGSYAGGQLRIVDPGAPGDLAAAGGAQDFGYYGDAGPQPYQRGQPAAPEYLDDVVNQARSGWPFSGFAGLASRVNPFLAGLVGAMTPTPAETGELPLSLSGARPQHPPSTGRMPPPPYDPLSSIRAPGARAPAPAGATYDPTVPLPPPRPRTSTTVPLPPPRPRTAPTAASTPPAARSPFTTIQYQVPGAGPLSRAPIYTALDLSALFGRR